MNIKCFFLENTGRTEELLNSEGKVHGWAPIYRRQDTGEEMLWRNAPVGAMMWATWMEDCPQYCGPDGRSLLVKTPGGEWYVDSVASNCTRKDDHVHKCWVRQGTPPYITVDKNGDTCAAGAGSIVIGSYHGFLRNGELTDC